MSRLIYEAVVRVRHGAAGPAMVAPPRDLRRAAHIRRVSSDSAPGRGPLTGLHALPNDLSRGKVTIV